MSNSESDHSKLSFDWLLSPWMVLTGVLVGAFIGMFKKSLVPYISPIGDWYLSLLQMCILPILLSAIASSLGRLMRSEVRNLYLKKKCYSYLSQLLF